jgi:hypothetical protein
LQVPRPVEKKNVSFPSVVGDLLGSLVPAVGRRLVDPVMKEEDRQLILDAIVVEREALTRQLDAGGEREKDGEGGKGPA